MKPFSIIMFENLQMMFQILITNEKTFWQAGDWIEGVVILNNKERRKVRSVRLKVTGVEHTEWSVNTEDNHYKYTGTEQMVDTVFTLWGFPRGSDQKQPLNEGLYVWPFQVALPSALRHASIEHKCGYVRYGLIAYIDVPWDSDIVFSKSIRVAPRSVLSLQQHLLVPQSFGDERSISCCCSSQGDIYFNVTCANRGFAAGDAIPVTIDIDNESDAAINGATLTLLEYIGFEARNRENSTDHKEKERAIVSNHFYFRVEPNEGHKSLQFNLQVPDGMPLTSFKSQFIERHFALHVLFAISDGMSSDVRLEFPLVGCSAVADTGVPPDMAPSILNPEGLPRHKFEPHRGEGSAVAAFCVDGMDYDPRDQIDVNRAVRYPTFYSPDFTMPQTLYQFNQTLFQVLVAIKIERHQTC